jgi:hypothetical protein
MDMSSANRTHSLCIALKVPEIELEHHHVCCRSEAEHCSWQLPAKNQNEFMIGHLLHMHNGHDPHLLIRFIFICALRMQSDVPRLHSVSSQRLGGNLVQDG